MIFNLNTKRTLQCLDCLLRNSFWSKSAKIWIVDIYFCFYKENIFHEERNPFDGKKGLETHKQKGSRATDSRATEISELAYSTAILSKRITKRLYHGTYNRYLTQFFVLFLYNSLCLIKYYSEISHECLHMQGERQGER